MFVLEAKSGFGCPMCDSGLVRICFENELTNPLHLKGAELVKCRVPDAVYEAERSASTEKQPT